MWNLKSIVLGSFLSHSYTELDLEEGLYVVQGINNTDEGQTSNGSGKSAIVEGIYYGLTGKSFRNVTKDKMVQRGEESAYLKLILENSRSSHVMIIERKIYKAKAEKIKVIIKRDKVEEEITHKCNDFILEQLGISSEDLTTYFIINKSSGLSFVFQNDKKRKETILKLSDVDFFDQAKEEVQADQSNLSSSKTKLEMRISAKKGKIEAHEERLNKLKSRTNKDKYVIEKLEKLKEITQGIISESKKIVSLQERLEGLKDELEYLKDPEPLDINLDELLTLKEDLYDSLRSFKEERSNLKGLLEREIHCPKCEHGFIIGDKSSPEEVQKQLKEIGDKILEKREEISFVEGEIADAKSEKDLYEREIKTAREERYDLKTKISRTESSLKIAQNFVGGADRRKEELKDLIKSYLNPSEIKDIQKDIEELKVNLKAAEKALKEVSEEIDTLSLVIDAGHSFKNFLCQSMLSVIESQVNNTLSKISPGTALFIEGFKVLKSGKIREKIDVSVLKNYEEGREPLGMYSAGESTRINLATIIAIRDLINMNSPTGGLNLLILDEIIESVDEKGARNIFESLSNVSGTIFGITHTNLSNAHEFKILNCIKDSGVTTVKVD